MVLGADFAGFLVRDGWSIYPQFTHALHQTCLAHLLRRCREMILVAERGEAEFPRSIETILQQSLQLRDRRQQRQISEQGLAVARGRLEVRMDRTLERRYRSPQNRRLANHLLWERDLNVFPIEMPPLRERKVDIPLLVTAFLTKHADSMRRVEAICEDFWRSVMSHDWPGNVRELENFVARCIALGAGPTLRDEDGCLISGEIGNNTPAEKGTDRLDAMERYTIVKVLEETKGDKIAAARILGIGKTTLYRKLRQYAQNPI